MWKCPSTRLPFISSKFYISHSIHNALCRAQTQYVMCMKNKRTTAKNWITPQNRQNGQVPNISTSDNAVNIIIKHEKLSSNSHPTQFPDAHVGQVGLHHLRDLLPTVFLFFLVNPSSLKRVPSSVSYRLTNLRVMARTKNILPAGIIPCPIFQIRLCIFIKFMYRQQIVALKSTYTTWGARKSEVLIIIENSLTIVKIMGRNFYELELWDVQQREKILRVAITFVWTRGSQQLKILQALVYCLMAR